MSPDEQELPRIGSETIQQGLSSLFHDSRNDNKIAEDIHTSRKHHQHGTAATNTSTSTNIDMNTNAAISRNIAWIEKRKAPRCISKRLLRVQGDSDSDNVDDNDNDNELYIISGVGKVWYGTRPAAEVVEILGIIPPRYLCFMVSGIVCDVVQFILYILLYYWLIKDASLCWMLSFFASVIFRHTSHRYLVFGDYVGGYYSSLGKMYIGYSIIIVLSTIFNLVMTKFVKVQHMIAWFITLLWTGIVNYFILKKIWSLGGNNDNNQQHEKTLKGV